MATDLVSFDNVLPGLPVWNARYGSRYAMNMAFIRFSEHYESPRFRNQIFDVEEYMDWYVAENGQFDYPNKWAGCNVPGSSVIAVRDEFTRHSRREMEVFRRLEEAGAFAAPRFYLLGTNTYDAPVNEGEHDTLSHEIRHALFYLNEPYRDAVTAVLRRHDARSVTDWLLQYGYCPEVLDDEVHAMALTGWHGIDDEHPLAVALTAELTDVERRFFPALRSG